MKTKVAQYIGAIQDGGAETLVKDYALLLDRKRFDVVIITRWKGQNSANQSILEKSGVRMLTIYPNNNLIFKVFNRLFGDIYIPHKLYKLLRKEKVEVLHGHLPLLHSIKPIANKIKDVRLLYTCHNKPKLLLEEKRKNEGRAASYLIKHNHLQMIALHNEMRNEINEMFGINNTVVIRNGIDFKRFLNVKKSKQQIRQSLNISDNAFVIGHVGRFDEQKNQSFLVDVFDEVSKKRDDAFLLMVGAGNDKEKIEAKLNSLGHTADYLILSHRSDIPEIMRAMDVFVFPSKYEGLGIVLIEAQVSGLRCVVSDKVPEEAFQTELVIPVSLDKSIQEWVDIVLDKKLKGTYRGNIDDYDMNKEIKRLESLYLGEKI